jgi:hypothetical protein
MRKRPRLVRAFLRGQIKQVQRSYPHYLGKWVHWFGMTPPYGKLEPTILGWSEVTLTGNDTLVTPSNPGPEVIGMSHWKSLV